MIKKWHLYIYTCVCVCMYAYIARIYWEQVTEIRYPRGNWHSRGTSEGYRQWCPARTERALFCFPYLVTLRRSKKLFLLSPYYPFSSPKFTSIIYNREKKSPPQASVISASLHSVIIPIVIHRTYIGIDQYKMLI